MGTGTGDIAGALTDVSASAVCEVRGSCSASLYLSNTLKCGWFLAPKRKFIMGWSPDNLQPCLRAAPTHPSSTAAVLWSVLVTLDRALASRSGCGGGVGVETCFFKNCARIRGNLAGNWRHLQNKREEVLLGGGGALAWPSHIYWWGVVFFCIFFFFVCMYVCVRKMTFVLCRWRDPDAA